MSFKTIENVHHSGAQKRGVAIGTHCPGKYSYTRIRFGPDILDIMNWAPGCRLGLAYGEGRHKGKLRIGLDDLNGFKIQKGAPRDKSKFLHCPRIGDGKAHRRETVSHKIVSNYLYIDLPDWAHSAKPEPAAAE